MKLKYSIGVLLVTSLSSHAAITTYKDASAFDWIYTQDVDSSAQDLDLNATADFFTGNAAEHPAIGGGTASFTNGDFYRGDFGGSLSRNNFFVATDSFTIDIDAQMLSTGAASGSLGTMALFWRASNGNSAIAYVDDSRVSVNNGGVIQTLSTDDNTDAFHDFRLAYDGVNGNFSVWRDGDLLGEEIDTVTLGGAAGLFVGDTGGSNSGDWVLNTMSITSGAFAVPEPSSAALLGLGGLALILRRRK